MPALASRVSLGLFLPFLLILSASCGGGGGGAPTASPTAPNAATASQIETAEEDGDGGPDDTGGTGVEDPTGESDDNSDDSDDALRIEKSTNGVDADSSEQAPRLTVGTQVTWRYVISNTGSGSLSGIRLTDDRLGSVRCGFERLGPGESGTCSAEGTVRSPGLYRNVGTVDAVYRISPTGFSTRVSDSDPSHYFGVEEQGGKGGCGLGYWKNHLDDWPPTGYSPNQSVESVFAASGAFPRLASATLLGALKFGGGPGAEGGAMILLRHAVAAVLNATHPRVAYSQSPSAVVRTVDDALRSGNRQRMLDTKDRLEAENEGECPLD